MLPDSRKKMYNYFKLILIGVSVLWLFLKSPFNPLYEKYTLSEMFSVYFSFVYWIIVFTFIFWIIFFINRINYEKHLSKILFISTSLWYLFFIPYGYETTDTGYHLSKQWSMFHGLWVENFNVFAGTNFFGGLWLLIAGQPSLLWAKIGFVLIQASIVLFTYKILLDLHYYKPVFVFIITFLVTFTLSYFQYFHTINYDNLSYLFLLIAFHFQVKDIYSGTNKKSNFIFSGVFTFLAIFSKLTYLTALMIPLMFLVLSKKVDKSRLYKNFLTYYKTIAVCSILFLFYVFTNHDLFDWYAHYMGNLLNESLKPKPEVIKETLLRDHSIFSLFNRYFLSGVMVFVNAFISIPFILLTAFLLKRFERSKILVWSVLTLFGVLFFSRIFIKGHLQIGLSAFYFSVFISFLFVYRKQIAERAQILVISAMIFIFSFLGSDLILNTAFRAGSGILLISLMILIISEHRSSKYFRFDRIIYVHIVLSFFFIIFIGSTDYRPYRDYRIAELKYNFESKCLYGVKSNIVRVGIVDSLMTYMNSIEDLREKRVFYAKGNALFYYLTGSNYILSSPWDMIIPLGEIENNLKSNPPDLFVTSAHTHSDGLWPYEHPGFINDPSYTKATKYYVFYESFLKENNYIEVYKNSFYTVYYLDKKGSGNVKQ